MLCEAPDADEKVKVLEEIRRVDLPCVWRVRARELVVFPDHCLALLVLPRRARGVVQDLLAESARREDPVVDDLDAASPQVDAEVAAFRRFRQQFEAELLGRVEPRNSLKTCRNFMQT